MNALTAPPDADPSGSSRAIRLTPALALSILISLLLFYTEIWALAGISWWSLSGLFHNWPPLQLVFGALFGAAAVWATWKSTSLVVASEYAAAAGVV